MPDEHELPGDLLLGARAVTTYVNTLLDPTTPITEGQFYAWVERGHLPVNRIGNRILGSKTQIRAALSGQTPLPPVAPRMISLNASPAPPLTCLNAITRATVGNAINAGLRPRFKQRFCFACSGQLLCRE